MTDFAIADEYEAVKSNRFADVLLPVFEIAGIDYGRADHATIDGRTVVYEINTNPHIGPYVPDPKPLRRETQILARQRLAAAPDAIDTTRKGTVKIPKSKIMLRRKLPTSDWLVVVSSSRRAAEAVLRDVSSVAAYLGSFFEGGFAAGQSALIAESVNDVK